MGNGAHRNGSRHGKQAATAAGPFQGVLHAVPASYAPPRDRAVSVKATVACPTCRAEIGATCTAVAPPYHELKACHPTRRRLAVRLDNLAREAARETRSVEG